jgi:hypothetical protein
MVVDGNFKRELSKESAAKKAGSELLANFSMLQIEIYDTTARSRAFGEVKKGRSLALTDLQSAH